MYIFRKVHIYLDHCYHANLVCMIQTFFQTINTVGQKGFDNKSMFCHRRKVGALFSYLITFVPISNIPITEGMNIILNKNTTAIIVVNYVDFQQIIYLKKNELYFQTCQQERQSSWNNLDQMKNMNSFVRVHLISLHTFEYICDYVKEKKKKFHFKKVKGQQSMCNCTTTKKKQEKICSRKICSKHHSRQLCFCRSLMRPKNPRKP